LEIDQPCGGKGTCGKCKVKVDGKDALACRYFIESDIEVETYECVEIVSETGAEESGRITDNLCYALDIGTTTLALALVSLDEKKAIKVITATNPQRTFGADVISRMDACRRHSVQALQKPLIDEINRMIRELSAPLVDVMYVCANVTMLHLFFGVDCASMGVAPYTPVFLKSKTEVADALGLQGVRRVISLPSIASFMGADIVAGLHLVGMPKEGKYNLLIDLGTNAEVVLYSSQRGVATSAAAGPCFEGANISCGMSATAGAICSFTLYGERAFYKTIGDAPARGICGTGLIDMVSELIRHEIIDGTGYMEEDYVLGEGIFLSREDVRQYQLAKSAVCSAILTLMRQEGVGFEDIAKVYVSGGFSAQIDLKHAAHSGLFPRELTSKAERLNNSSLLGAIRYACEGGEPERFCRMISYTDLSNSPYFSKLFMENMMFR